MTKTAAGRKIARILPGLYRTTDGQIQIMQVPGGYWGVYTTQPEFNGCTWKLQAYAPTLQIAKAAA